MSYSQEFLGHVDNYMEKNMENDMGTGVIQGIMGINISHTIKGHGLLLRNAVRT